MASGLKPQEASDRLIVFQVIFGFYDLLNSGNLTGVLNAYLLSFKGRETYCRIWYMVLP